MENVAWAFAASFGCTTALFALATRLAYKQGRKWQGWLRDFKAFHRNEIGKVNERVEQLEVENEVLTDLVKAQADRAEAFGINDPVMVYRPDGSSYSRDYFIHEQP